VFLGRLRRVIASPFMQSGRARPATAMHFTVDDLRPLFGTYRTSRADSLPPVILATAVAALVAHNLSLGGGGVFVIALIVAAVSTVLMGLERRSVRIIGPDRIAFVSPIGSWPWSVPMAEVRHCELVRASLTTGCTYTRTEWCIRFR
jgi:hypothetical protein